MAGTVIADTLQGSATGTPPVFNDGSGTQIGTLCRAWVNFDGTLTNPIAPRASFNVGSITKNSTGNYTLNFTNAMPDDKYCFSAGLRNNVGTSGLALQGAQTVAQTANSLNVECINGGTRIDVNTLCIAVFR